MVHGDDRESCEENPGFEVDVYFRATLRTLSEIWWGDLDLRTACDRELLKVTGSPVYTKNLAKWFRVSSFAGENSGHSTQLDPPAKTRVTSRA